MSLVSIITPSYKSKAIILETLLSIEKQTYKDFEVLIVDDASPDGSADYIEQNLPDNRFKIIKLDKNVGAAEARNVAVRKATGKYIAFLDSDDLWHPNKLEKQIDFMQKNDIAFSFSAYEVIDEEGGLVKEKISVPSKITKSQYLGNTVIGCLTVILDRSKISQDILMPNLRSSHDMALWVNLLEEVKVAYGYQEVLASYRLVGSSNTANKSKAAKEVWDVYRGYLKYNIFLSSYYFVQYALNAILKRL
ncbi:glycosyltransferase family 2 protein [Colwellia sp. E2M01]|uniref:glycosyltransferase family 2 protein n=1 Tax=Colwellia sp. E2M01 TaxID=2841561 RepID=UPI001C0A2436|nr:glycosyltransferase family 2 protein [Colwellia sp. E2M01]MBU2869209.1 glycosyltransferase [Colwellia sp. E2M01]